MTDTDATRRVLGDLAAETRRFGPGDEHRHAAPASPTWAETSWWVFTHPDEHLIGWVYVLTRPALGVASVGVWIWDGSGSEPRELLHSKLYAHVALPDDYDLTRLRLLDGGLEIDVEEPLHRYRLHYVDGDVELELRFVGVIEPQPLGIGDATGHADQPLLGQGSLRLGERQILVDGPAFRDRTWSERPETSSGLRNAYTWAVGDAATFQLLVMLDDDDETPLFLGGFVLQDGEVAALERCRRIVEQRGPDGRPEIIKLKLTDVLGRHVEAVGRCRSAAALPGFTGYLTWASLVEWDIDGTVVWGEDHDSWAHMQWRARHFDR